MAVDYEGIISSDMLILDIEAHLNWFCTLLKRMVFNSNDAEVSNLYPPDELMEWCQRQADIHKMPRDIADEVENLHIALSKTVHRAFDSFQNREVKVEDFEEIKVSLDDYIAGLKKLGAEGESSGSGIDPVTGVRSHVGMKKDLERELDRRDRKGEPFCVCNAKIDNMQDIFEKYDYKTANIIIGKTGKLLASILRSFDDIYHVGEGEFIICLKNIDLLDGGSVMDRIRSIVANNFIDLSDNHTIKVTASFGVIEPVPGDNMNEILVNVQDSMNDAAKAGGDRVEQSLEVSALERYAQEVRKE